jgi:ferredoxin-nitrite reductase
VDIANGFSKEQQQYLQGFVLGADLARSARGLAPLAGLSPGGGSAGGGTASAPPKGPDALLHAAQDRFTAAGKALCPEEKAKRERHGLDLWDTIHANAEAGKFPSGTDVFLYKYSGLFFVAPAQNSFMSRLKVPGGIMSAEQFRGVADLAEQFGAGHADVTTRANLQVREIAAGHAERFLLGLYDLGLVNKGSGADNVRNVTANPTSGIDPREWIETLPLARAMNHYVLNRRECFGLPRKFNIAFDGGGTIGALEDTNDLGFRAVKVRGEVATAEVPAGLYFEVILGGITGHGDFARGTNVLVRPGECVEFAGAVLRAFIAKGDRTDRKKARLKYVLDSLGFDGFLAGVEEEWKRPLLRFPADQLERPESPDRWGHVGVHPQKQAGRNYLGVVLPVGRLTVEQMRGLADLSRKRGDGTVRLTVWQNLLLAGIRDEDLADAAAAIEDLGLAVNASSARAGLVACTGNRGCKYASADTKGHAMAIAEHIEAQLTLHQPINIHLTGCHHSCAQHAIGDIGLLATQVEVGDEMVEGYRVFVGGGHGDQQGMGSEVGDPAPFEEIPELIERLLAHYLEHRDGDDEGYARYARRLGAEAIRDAVRAPERAIA